MKHLKRVLVILVGLHFGSCETDMNPVGEFRPMLAVYCILSNASDTQYVRVLSNYIPPQNDPSLNLKDPSIKGASVQIDDGAQTFTFRDTTIIAPKSGRYSDTIHAYVCYGFRVVANKEYTLNVLAQGYSPISGKTRTPGTSFLSPGNYSVYSYPWDNRAGPPKLTFTLSPLTAAYRVSLVVEYHDRIFSDTIVSSREIPDKMYLIDCFYEIFHRSYPPVQRRDPLVTTATFQWDKFSYRKTIEQVWEGGINREFRRAIFYLAQFDDPYYKYYSAVTAFQDRNAIRLDYPDYSNIEGGAGVFAALTIDTLVIPLPANIIPPPNTNPCF